jgi:hypothetical protein
MNPPSHVRAAKYPLRSLLAIWVAVRAQAADYDRLFKAIFLILFWLVLMVLAPCAQGETNYIYMTEIGFDPNYLEIQLGDTVIWANIDDSFDDHTTHSYTYPWNSGLVGYLEAVSFTPSKTGTYPYQDDLTGASATLVIKAPTPPSAILTNAFRLPSGNFQFTVTNLVVGKTNIVQASTNLVNWTNLYTNIASATSFNYQDTGAPNFKLRRFYRAYTLP